MRKDIVTLKDVRRSVLWGAALAAEFQPLGVAGLAGVVEVIDKVVGREGFRGVRASYAPLTRARGWPASLADSSRAWLVLSALGADPSEWGWPGPESDDLGRYLDRDRLAADLQSELWQGKAHDPNSWPIAPPDSAPAAGNRPGLAA